MRIEYHDSMHMLCLLPIAQQVIGAATIVSSLARLVCHVVEGCFSKSPQVTIEIQKDKEGLYLGLLRFIPSVGSIVSFLILSKMDQAEGGPIFPALAGRGQPLPSN